MKKLLLAVSLLTSVASAQFIERIEIDPMTDEKTYRSEILGTMDYSGRPATGRFILSCVENNELGIFITSTSVYNTKVNRKSVEVRVLPSDRQYSFDMLAVEKGIILFNPKADSIEQLSNSELRVRFKDEINYTSYLTFDLPDLTQSEAYKACNSY